MTRKLVSAITVALMCVTWAGQANADFLGDHYNIAYPPGTWFPGIGGGGEFTSSANFLTGPLSGPVSLQNNYCIQYFNAIGYSGNNTFIYNTFGFIDGVKVTNADEIAYLLLNHSAADQMALQAAIWSLYAGSGIPFPPGVAPTFNPALYLNSTQMAIYNSIKNDAIANGHDQSLIARILWISPYTGPLTGHPSTTHWIQAQIATAPSGLVIPVPEPSTLALLGLGGFGVVANAIRRRRTPKAAA